ncbi:MAG TPA: 16S rRNA (cytosine(967)-C(5))-methyltransferase RsmB [Nitrospirales bacterium]|nr:16S rRNA (cytosine(967)-C(5))-methyltransferase RsmB [Nitrospirales bacterium]
MTRTVSMTRGRPGVLPSPARRAAFEALLAVERGGFADEALEQAAHDARVDRRDFALAQELTYGVLRQRGMLDWRLAALADRPLTRMSAAVLTALRLGAYQLLVLSRIPASAAVNESVLLVRGAAEAHAAGFVNAILRALPRTDPPVIPDLKTDPVDALAIRYSCPPWLVTRWVTRLGRVQAEALCASTVEIPPLTVRVNSLRTTREQLLAAFAADGVAAQPTAHSASGVLVEANRPVTELPGFADGHFYIEDEGGQLVAPLLDPQPGERILDACAAPGGKATHLAMLMRNAGEIVAVDVDARRLARVRENAERLGATIIQPLQTDLTKPAAAALAAAYDRVLVDAPCSGLGVLRRHPEGKWQKRATALARHQEKQLAILNAVVPALRPGGTLLYSTCSTEPEENELVIARFCQAHPEFFRESIAPWLPPAACAFVTADGSFSTMSQQRTPSMDRFFAARLGKHA